MRDRDERYRSPGQTNRWLCLVDYKASGSVTFNNITVVELQKMRSESGYARQSVQLESAVEELHFLFGNYPEGVSKRGLPMIILLDLMLPKIDEHEVLGEIKSKKPTKLIPVVILTSSKEEEDVLKDYDLGANGYVCQNRWITRVLLRWQITWEYIGLP